MRVGDLNWWGLGREAGNNGYLRRESYVILCAQSSNTASIGSSGGTLSRSCDTQNCEPMAAFSVVLCSNQFSPNFHLMSARFEVKPRDSVPQLFVRGVD